MFSFSALNLLTYNIEYHCWSWKLLKNYIFKFIFCQIQLSLCFIESHQCCQNHIDNRSDSLNVFLLCSIFAKSRHDGDCCWLEPIGEIAMYVELHMNVYWLFHRSTFFSSRLFVLFAPRLSVSRHQYEASRRMHGSVSNGDAGEQRRLQGIERSCHRLFARYLL